MNAPSSETPQQIRVDQFNAAMFLDHNTETFWKVMKSWGAFFLCRDPEYFRRNAEVNTYLKYIKNQNPDIAYVTEVCGREQRDALIRGFEEMGYYVHVKKGFELWSMQKDSHKFLYHITASKFPIEEINHFEQYTDHTAVKVLKKSGPVFMRVLKSVLGLGKLPPNLTEDVKGKVQGILDGSGSHLRVKIDDTTHLELLVAHVQTQTTNQVLADLAKSASESDDRNMHLLIGDLNQTTETSEAVVRSQNPRLHRLDTDPTYPKIFANDQGYGLAGMVNRGAKKLCPPHLDQIFTNKKGHVTSIRNLGPEETGLKSDHTYNTYTVEVPQAS